MVIINIKSVAIGIPVNNLEKSAKWYKDIFEPEKKLISTDFQMIEYKTGPIWIQLFEGKTEINDNVVNFEVENLEKEYNRLKEMTVISNEEIIDISDVIKYLEFKDPDGNKLTFVEIYPESELKSK